MYFMGKIFDLLRPDWAAFQRVSEFCFNLLRRQPTQLHSLATHTHEVGVGISLSY